MVVVAASSATGRYCSLVSSNMVGSLDDAIIIMGK